MVEDCTPKPGKVTNILLTLKKLYKSVQHRI